jgi:hypothetical protein
VVVSREQAAAFDLRTIRSASFSAGPGEETIQVAGADHPAALRDLGICDGACRANPRLRRTDVGDMSVAGTRSNPQGGARFMSGVLASADERQVLHRRRTIGRSEVRALWAGQRRGVPTPPPEPSLSKILRSEAKVMGMFGLLAFCFGQHSIPSQRNDPGSPFVSHRGVDGVGTLRPFVLDR